MSSHRDGDVPRAHLHHHPSATQRSSSRGDLEREADVERLMLLEDDDDGLSTM
jgi:hypothetical protein